MNETLTTLRGTIITNPSSRRVGDDPVFSFRVACNTRYQDRETKEWRNGSTLYLAASCWGHLAHKVGGRLFMGDHVILQGRLVSNEYERDGVPCRDTEMRVTAIGPDMARMDVTVRRPKKADGTTEGQGGSAADGRDGAATDGQGGSATGGPGGSAAVGEGPKGDDDEADVPTDVSGLVEEPVPF